MRTIIWKPALFGALLLALVVALALAASCNPGEKGATGQLAIALTDNPAADPEVEQVWVTIDGISVHHRTADGEGEWVKPAAGVSFPLTVDLLGLCDAAVPLGLDSLPAGDYTQIRLHLGKTAQGRAVAAGHARGKMTASKAGAHPHANYVVLDGGDTAELIVPRGCDSGIKLIHGFKIEENKRYALTLDFDAASSIHRNSSGKYVLRPVIHVIKEDAAEPTLGKVTAPDGCVDVGGVTVTAQDPTSLEVVYTTVTDAEGNYAPAYLPAGTYNLVAYKDDPAAGQVALGIEPGVVVANGEAVTPTISLQCYHPRAAVCGGVLLIPPSADEVVPQVTVVTTDASGHQFVLATVDTAWADYPYYSYRFSLGTPAEQLTFIFKAEGYQSKTLSWDVWSLPDLGKVALSRTMISAP